MDRPDRARRGAARGGQSGRLSGASRAAGASSCPHPAAVRPACNPANARCGGFAAAATDGRPMPPRHANPAEKLAGGSRGSLETQPATIALIPRRKISRPLRDRDDFPRAVLPSPSSAPAHRRSAGAGVRQWRARARRPARHVPHARWRGREGRRRLRMPTDPSPVPRPCPKGDGRFDAAGYQKSLRGHGRPRPRDGEDGTDGLQAGRVWRPGARARRGQRRRTCLLFRSCRRRTHRRPRGRVAVAVAFSPSRPTAFAFPSRATSSPALPTRGAIF
jgi:hypothetical protein